MARLPTRAQTGARTNRRSSEPPGGAGPEPPAYAALRREFPFLTAERTLRGGERLDGITLRLTTRCNQRCPFCQAVDPRSEPDPSLPALRRAVDRIASTLPGSSVVLTGGEPCLRPDLPRLLRYLLERPGIRLVELQTNAVPLGARSAPVLPASGRLSVLVGLHALDPAIYDAATATRGQLPAALRGVRRLLEAGAAVELNCVVSRLNLAHVPQMPELLVRALGPNPPPLHFSVMGIPEQRPVGRLLVRFTELLAAVAEARRRAEPLGVVVRLAPSASHAVVPACLLARTDRPPLGEPVGYDHEGPQPDREQWWVQGPACEGCAARTSCRGLPRAYAARFGFGELSALGPDHSGTTPRRPAPGDGPERAILEAGPHGRRLVRRLLGLDEPDDRFDVSRARWSSGRLEVAVATANGETAELVLEPTGDDADRRPFLSHGRIDLWYHGRLPAGLEPRLREAAARWPATPLERLLAPLEADARLVTSTEPPAGGPPDTAGTTDRRGGNGPHGRTRVRLGTWDPETSYADFFGRDALELMPYEAIEAGNPLVRISHSDLECLSFMPRECPANLNLVDFPWIAPDDRGGTAVKQRELMLCTDMTERSVILGCDARVRRVLDGVLALDSDKPIVFSNTCLPATTGEDVMSVLRRYKDRARVSVVSHNRAAPDRDDDMPGVLTCAPPATGAARRVRRRPDLVNLIGFPHDRGLAELERLLAGLGLRVNAAVLPVVDPAQLSRFPRAALNVFHRTNRFWEDAYRRLAARHPIPALHPPNPYGVAGTRAWLDAVATATNRRPRARATWDRCFGPLQAEWRRQTAGARGLTVGLVLRPEDVECLEDPGLTNGIPLLAVLAELGFDLELWVRAHDGVPQALRERLVALVPEPHRPRCRIAGFAGFDELRRALRESPAAAVVGNHTFDWRLTEAGKSRISFAHFEPGPDGAVRTARRLLEVCRTPFARHYARFLARDDLGRRRNPPAED